MNHKLAVKIAVVMIIVFGVITVLYPRLFAPKPAGDATIAAPPPAGP